MINKIILASSSEVRIKILNKNGINCEVIPANVDEDQVKESLINEKASPEIISKNLAELKANKVSEKRHNHLVLGADSVIDLKGELISKPKNRISVPMVVVGKIFIWVGPVSLLVFSANFMTVLEFRGF